MAIVEFVQAEIARKEGGTWEMFFQVCDDK